MAGGLGIELCGVCYKPLKVYPVPGTGETVKRCAEKHIDHRLHILYPKIFPNQEAAEKIDWECGCYVDSAVC